MPVTTLVDLGEAFRNASQAFAGLGVAIEHLLLMDRLLREKRIIKHNIFWHGSTQIDRMRMKDIELDIWAAGIFYEARTFTTTTECGTQ